MEQVQSKLYSSLKPPLPNIRILHSPKSPNIPYSPTHNPIIRRNGSNKSIKKPSAQKSQNQKAFQLQIKYSKEPKQQIKTDPSIFAHSEDTIGRSFNRLPEDTQQTIQRITSFSRQKKDRLRSGQKSLEKGNKNIVDSFAGFSQSISKKTNSDKNQEYYLYWKNKAHQYLQSNIKFMEQISSLTRQKQQLMQIIVKLNITQTAQQNIKEEKLQQGQNMNSLRQISLHYLSKIEEMQRQLKRKQINIETFQVKIKELNQTVIGERQRTKLINTMKIQIDQLKMENESLSKQFRQHNTNSTTQRINNDKRTINKKQQNPHK